MEPNIPMYHIFSQGSFTRFCPGKGGWIGERAVRQSIHTSVQGCRTFSPNSHPLGSLYCGAPWEANRLPEAILCILFRTSDEDAENDMVGVASGISCDSHTLAASVRP
jgi:hypothetical protein